MLTDSKIIQRHAEHCVMAPRYEVMWPNGTSIGLHPVLDAGVEHAFLRAIEHQAGHWIVVDLRDLAPGLAADIKQLPRRDAVGVVFHTLRLTFPDAPAFISAAINGNRGAWFSGSHVGMGSYARIDDRPPPPNIEGARSWIASWAGVSA
jgi:hypothetical protein